MQGSRVPQDTELLRRYVGTFGTWDELIEPAEEVPSELRVPHHTGFVDGWVHWRPLAFTTPAAAADELESLLPAPFPPLFRSLVLSYRYLGVDLGRYQLLANPPSAGLDGLKEAMFRDECLSRVLLRHDFILIGGPYDPVCFNAAGRRREGEMEVVSLDHEQILCNERIKIVERLAASFRDLVGDTIRRHEQQIGASSSAAQE